MERPSSGMESQVLERRKFGFMLGQLSRSWAIPVVLAFDHICMRENSQMCYVDPTLMALDLF